MCVLNWFTDGETEAQAEENNHSTIALFLWSLFSPWPQSHETGNNSRDFSGFLSFMHCCHHLNRWIAAALGLCDYGPVSFCATQNKSKDLIKMGFPCPSFCNGDAIAYFWMVIVPGKDGSGNPCRFEHWSPIGVWGESSLMLRVYVAFQWVNLGKKTQAVTSSNVQFPIWHKGGRPTVVRAEAKAYFKAPVGMCMEGFASSRALAQQNPGLSTPSIHRLGFKPFTWITSILNPDLP